MFSLSIKEAVPSEAAKIAKIQFSTNIANDTETLIALAAETTLGSNFFVVQNPHEMYSSLESEGAEGTVAVHHHTIDILRQPSPESSSPLSLPSEKRFPSSLHTNDVQASCAEITPLLKRDDRKRKFAHEPQMSNFESIQVNRFDSLAAHYFATDLLPSTSEDTHDLSKLILGIENGIMELNKVLISLSTLIDPCTTKYGTKMNSDVRAYLDWVMNIKEEVEQRTSSWKERRAAIEDEMIACIEHSMKRKLSD